MLRWRKHLTRTDRSAWLSDLRPPARPTSSPASSRRSSAKSSASRPMWGMAPHRAGELFNMMAGIKLTPVHYKGGGETLKDLVSGEVKVMFSTIPPVLGFVKEGSLRGIATTGAKRDNVLPDLPTIAESGL